MEKIVGDCVLLAKEMSKEEKWFLSGPQAQSPEEPHSSSSALTFENGSLFLVHPAPTSPRSTHLECVAFSVGAS